MPVRPSAQRWMRQVGLCQRPPRRAHEVAVLLGRRRRRRMHDCIIAVGWDEGPRDPAEALGVATGLDGANPPPELLPKQDDIAISGPPSAPGHG